VLALLLKFPPGAYLVISLIPLTALACGYRCGPSADQRCAFGNGSLWLKSRSKAEADPDRSPMSMLTVRWTGGLFERIIWGYLEMTLKLQINTFEP
jgi:hypothetical protein